MNISFFRKKDKSSDYALNLTISFIILSNKFIEIDLKFKRTGN